MDAHNEDEKRRAEEEGRRQKNEQAERGAGILGPAARSHQARPLRKLPDDVDEAEHGGKDGGPESGRPGRGGYFRKHGSSLIRGMFTLTARAGIAPVVKLKVFENAEHFWIIRQ